MRNVRLPRTLPIAIQSDGHATRHPLRRTTTDGRDADCTTILQMAAIDQSSGSPEQHELKRKLEELSALQMVLAEKELELATLENELTAFGNEYTRRVGVKYAELDELEALTAEQTAAAVQTADTRRQASEARARAEESAQAVTGIVEDQPEPPTDEIKQLFREVAKAIHPDLATSEADRRERERLMAAANEAYRNRDIARLRQILADWRASPHTVVGDDVGAQLVRALRSLARVRSRIEAIDHQLDMLRASEICILKRRVDEAFAAGNDLLADLASDLDERIAAASSRLRGPVS